MKNIISIIFLSVICLSFKSFQSDSHVKQVEKFLAIVTNKDFNENNKSVESLLVPLQTEHDSIKLKRRNLLFLQLNSLHKDLQNKKVKNLIIAPYKRLPKEEQNIFSGNESVENIYVVKSDKKHVMTISFKGNLIKSISTMNKGGTRIIMAI